MKHIKNAKWHGLAFEVTTESQFVGEHRITVTKKEKRVLELLELYPNATVTVVMGL